MSTLFKDSLITLVSRILGFILGLVSTIIISRLLGPADKGTYSLLVLVISIMALVFNPGIALANVYFSARRPEWRGKLVGNSFVVSIGLGSLAIITLEASTMLSPVQHYLLGNNVELEWIRLIALLIPFVLFNRIVPEILRGAGLIVSYNLVSIISIFINLVLLSLLLMMLDQGLNGSLIAFVVLQFAQTVFIVWLLLRHIGGHWTTSLDVLKQSFFFGIRSYPGDLAQFLNYRLDQLIVGLYLSPRDLGIYVTAVVLAEKLWEIPHAVSIGLLYNVASHTGNPIATTERASRIMVALVGIICLGVALISYPMIYLMYGQEYIYAATALISLLPGIWALSLGRVIAAHLSGINKPQSGTYAAVVSLVITVLLDFLLIPRIGILGAGLTSSIAYSLAAVVLIREFLRHSQSDVRKLLIIKSEDIHLFWAILFAAIQRRFARPVNPVRNS